MRRLGWVLVALAACGRTEPVPGTDKVDSLATASDPDSAAVARFRAALPPELLARRNACPFECCVYGNWLADTTITVLAQPQDTDTPAFVLNKGDKFRADSGIVFITSIALAVVDDTVFRYADKKPWLLPGDTLVLLDPIGEGYWNAWRRGEILEEVPPFFESVPEPKRGRMIGKPSREWWVHATVSNRKGWFHADKVRVRGADACGGPVPGLP